MAHSPSKFSWQILSRRNLDLFVKVRWSQLLGQGFVHLQRSNETDVEAIGRYLVINSIGEKSLQRISRYLVSWSGLELSNVGEGAASGHPLHIYALTRHVALGWPALETTLTRLHNQTKEMEWAVSRSTSGRCATKEDLSQVSAGMARLHDFYSLNLTMMRQHGALQSCLNDEPVYSSLQPTARDFHQIGMEAASNHIFNSGVDFLAAALDAIETTNTTHEEHQNIGTDFSSVQKDYKTVTKMHDQVLERKGPRTKKHSTRSRPVDRKLAKKKKYHRSKESLFTIGKVGSEKESVNQYWRLCRGEDHRPVKIKSQLYCRYVNNGSPLFLIGPLKMEIHSLDPYVITIEDFLHPNERSKIINRASVNLETSSTFRGNGGSEVGVQRTSSTAWLWEYQLSLLPNLTHRMQEITGTYAKEHFAAEAYQVLNYGVGGHYTVHHDAISKGMVYNRFATIFMYLTDVEKGGLTVFPWLGVGIEPRAGRVLVWYNTDKAGNRDDRLEHGACPVLLGSKWAINKWLHYGGQYKAIPCGLTVDEKINQPL
ncbi:unnamed protein product, partial [Meganyctiphanes norvegica]